MKFVCFATAFLVINLLEQPLLAREVSRQNDPIIASVNGKSIYRSDLEIARTRLPEQYRNLPVKELFQPLLNQLIRSTLLAMVAKTQNLDKTTTHKRAVAFAQVRLLEQALLEREIAKNVTKEAVRARYKNTIGKSSSKEEIRVRHILLKTQNDALKIVKELVAGANFARLATERSTGPSKTRGGDLNYFGRGQMVPQFEEAAFGLSIGEFTKKPVRTQFGWHIIKLEDKRISKPPSFEEIRAKIQRDMAGEVVSKFVTCIIKKANIQRFEMDGSKPRLRRIQNAPTR